MCTCTCILCVRNYTWAEVDYFRCDPKMVYVFIFNISETQGTNVQLQQ